MWNECNILMDSDFSYSSVTIREWMMMLYDSLSIHRRWFLAEALNVASSCVTQAINNTCW